jgi:tRNA(Ile)-lysidine synthase
MKKTLQTHLNQNLPFLKDKKLLIAISGGIDSIVLTTLFYKLNYSISLAHCNFSLRGKESNKDEAFIKALGQSYDVPTYSIKFETEKYANENGISTQMAARELRYNWFAALCEEHQFDFVLTAHHKDDVIETFLINLTRGTGMEGLLGIPEINGHIVRPLLPFSRNDILIYATKKKLQWREDQSNSSIKYVRNKIRHRVVPFLKEINPNLLDTFTNTLENLRGSQQIVKDRIENIRQDICTTVNGEIHFDLATLNNYSNPKVYLYELLKGYGFTAWDDILNLLNAQSGKRVYSNTHRLLKNRGVFILSEIETDVENKLYPIEENTKNLEDPIPLKFERVRMESNPKDFFKHMDADQNSIAIDNDLLQYPLILRKWEKGDYFFPLGLGGKKKISKYFKDEKMSLTEKEKCWILSSKNNIIWVIGKRMDDRFKLTNSTNTVLKIQYL